MHFESNHIYHVYNRGNNKIRIFFTPANYLFFLKKVRLEWLPHSDILCYCLMPNHFHFMLQPKEDGCLFLQQKGITNHLQVLSKTIGKTLSSYTQAINIQNNTTGNLFQKKTKAKSLTDITWSSTLQNNQDYLANCFYYIHNNPLEAGLVRELKNWPYSSYRDYYGIRQGTLCNKQLLMKVTGISPQDFSDENILQVNNEWVKGIW